MIFIGDVVYPFYDIDLPLINADQQFLNCNKIANFESVLSPFAKKIKTKGIALYSSEQIEHFFKTLNIKYVTLSNNHIFDFDYNIDELKSILHNWGIISIGAGNNLADASIPLIDHEKKTIVLTFGWEVIRCKLAKENSPGVNPYKYNWVIKQVNKFKSEYKDYFMITSFHWNYEFEQYPQPADREFCFKLIDIGVDAIVGHHAHIIQGYEFYHQKPIFYGLGNFYFPNYSYNNFSINFPEKSRFGLSVEINATNNIAIYISELKGKLLTINKKISPEKCNLLKDVSGFQDLSHKDYISFFKSHRTKTKLLPIYKSYKNNIQNGFNDIFVKLRQIPVDVIGRMRSK